MVPESAHQVFVRIDQGRIRATLRWHSQANDVFVMENFVAACVGFGLLIYLGYALIRPDRF
jgi:K+-transporting ATPase KdpF subunit